jgi:hypothetical protein
MLEATSKPTSKPSETTPPISAESSNAIKSIEEEKESNLTRGDTDTQTPELDEAQEQQLTTTSPPPEYLHPDEQRISHPLHHDLEALLFDKETELIEPTQPTLSGHQQPDSEVQALTFIDENGKVVNVIVEGEEYDWSTSSVEIAHREICPVCLGVVKRGKGEAREDGAGNEDEGSVRERTDPKECSRMGGDIRERICKGCEEELVKSLWGGE